jgi:hypothetical protein
MALVLFACAGGSLVLPNRGSALCDRADGGHLVVEPPRPVWERSELDPGELAAWTALVAAAGRAMIDRLPQLRDGCVNYWEAGNWALHAAADPPGAKDVRAHRRVHLHLLGRSRMAEHDGWRWGEAPAFPRFVERAGRGAAFERLSGRECVPVVERTDAVLRQRYGFEDRAIRPWGTCATCGYPIAEAADAR